MLKIFFSLLICVLGHSTVLNNVTQVTEKNDLSEDLRADSFVTNENAVKALNKKTGIYKEGIDKNYYTFPEYSEDVMLSKMRNSLLYVLVPIYKSADCIVGCVSSLSKAIKELPIECIVYSVSSRR